MLSLGALRKAGHSDKSTAFWLLTHVFAYLNIFHHMAHKAPFLTFVLDMCVEIAAVFRIVIPLKVK